MLATKTPSGAFLLATLLVHYNCDDPYGMIIPDPHVDITKFYTQDAEIWTVNTTMPTNITCKVDLVKIATTSYVNFTRCYFWFGVEATEFLEGLFETVPFPGLETTFNAMKVKWRAGPFCTEEVLLYADEEYTCGVFSVKYLVESISPGLDEAHKGGPYIEVRVKITAIENPNEECFRQFITYSSGVNYTTIYENDCRDRRCQWHTPPRRNWSLKPY